jgi:quinoprotein dehydrogenase-associated probable ABC transporter substrate-binding protein
VSYTYFPQVIGFVRNTLNALRCDVVMGAAVGDDLVQTTNPYYRTVYALIFKPNSGLDGIESLEDPRLKDTRIGVVAGTPPASIMVKNGLMDRAKPYPLMVDTRQTSVPELMTADLAAGTIDVGVLWGPMAGYFAQKSNPKLTVVPLLKEPAQMDFRIAMGVRRTDQDWKRKLNALILKDQSQIDKILASYGVPLLDEQDRLKEP